MPYAPARPCTAPGCGALVRNGPRCDKHKRQEMREYNKRRGGSTAQGYGSKWQTARAAYLLSHPLCVTCHTQGRIVQACVVDHIKPHKGNQALFWSQSNWQALCRACHDRKTVKDGRWN